MQKSRGEYGSALVSSVFSPRRFVNLQFDDAFSRRAVNRFGMIFRFIYIPYTHVPLGGLYETDWIHALQKGGLGIAIEAT